MDEVTIPELFWIRDSVGGTPADAIGSASTLLRRDKTVALPEKAANNRGRQRKEIFPP